MILFVSAMLYVVVVAGTALWGRRSDEQKVEFSEPLEGTPEYGLWDRFAVWATLAVVLIVLAYAVPISHLCMMERFPSLPQKPF